MPKRTSKRSGKRKVSRKASKGKKRKSSRKSVKKSKKVSKILASTYGIGALMKEDQKGYKAQRVANKDVYKVESSGPYGLEHVFKENQKGYKAQRVAKKDKYKKAKPPPIPSNIKGKKKKKKSSSSKAAKDSFLAGIDSKPSKKGNWIDHVKQVWVEGKKGNPGYKYKDAMKDAKKTW